VRLVVDAGVIVGVCLAGGDLGPLAGHALIAPAHLAAEVTSALREQAFRGSIPADRAIEAVGFLGAIPIDFEPPGSHATAAAQLATDLGWAKTYDAEYVVLARSKGIPLMTLDGRLRRGAAGIVQAVAPLEV
jgi:predicted nucleic acid-binding protein